MVEKMIATLIKMNRLVDGCLSWIAIAIKIAPVLKISDRIDCKPTLRPTSKRHNEYTCDCYS